MQGEEDGYNTPNEHVVKIRLAGAVPILTYKSFVSTCHFCTRRGHVNLEKLKFLPVLSSFGSFHTSAVPNIDRSLSTSSSMMGKLTLYDGVKIGFMPSQC